MPPRREAASARAAGDTLAGFAYALGAYSLWGIAAAYFKLVADVPLVEVIAHRIVWSLLVVGVVLAATRALGQITQVLASRRMFVVLAATSLLILANWSTYFWAVSTGRILEVSLGYYINPLMSVVLGVVLLGERLSRLQAVAVALACAAVVILGLAIGGAPWLPLTLATTFAAYGFLRKSVDVGAAAGVFIEVAILAPFALAVLVWLEADGASHLGAPDVTALWLALTGVWTAVPLMLFGAGARRLRLSTLGLMQYVAPSIHFLLAVFAFGEAPTPAHLAAFALIWTALAIYSAEAIALRRRQRVPPPA